MRRDARSDADRRSVRCITGYSIEALTGPDASDSTLAVTVPCRDARSVRPLYQRLQRLVLMGTDAQIVRPYFKFAE